MSAPASFPPREAAPPGRNFYRRGASRAAAMHPINFGERVAKQVEKLLVPPRGQSFFCDDGQTWSEGRNMRPPMTHAEAINHSRNLQNALYREESGAARRLANRLQACSPNRPCLMFRCIPCARAFQAALVHVTDCLPGLRDGSWCSVSAVPAGWGVRLGRLAEHDPIRGLANGCRKMLYREGLIGVAGIDLSHNWHQTAVFRDHYRPHAHMQILGDADTIRGKLRPWFEPSEVVTRPLVVKQFDGSRNGIAYLMKPLFHQRQTLVRQLDEHGYPCGASTRMDDMRVAERVEIALATDRLRLSDRLVVHGLDLIDDGKAARLVLHR